MDKLKTLVKYATYEIITAEDYIKMADCYSDNADISSKFQEIAIDELKHHKYDVEIIKSIIKNKKDNNEDVQEFEDSLLYDVYHDWFKSVEDKINNFKIKR